MARVPVMAAGGIVLRRQQPPLIAVVRLRKRDEWVLPKGKLDDGETPRAAARREVLEETGHVVTVHEFLGTLAYDAGGRSKIVHYWRMEAGGEQAYELMSDVRAVDWLPLNAAVERLSRPHEQAFLANVGPQAVASFARRQKEKAPPSRKRRSPSVVAPAPILPDRPRAVPVPKPRRVEPVPEIALAELTPTAPEPVAMPDPVAVMEMPRLADEALPEPHLLPHPLEADAEIAETIETEFDAPETADQDGEALASSDRQRRSLAQKVRDWFGRAA